MDVKDAISRFYYDMTLNELRRMHTSGVRPSISYNSLLYLDLIDLVPDCTVSRLAEILQVSKPAVTIKVNELEKLGLIEKSQSTTDKRVFYLKVNAQLVEEYRAYDRSFRRALTAVKEQYSENELDVFCKVLTTFSDAYMEK